MTGRVLAVIPARGGSRRVPRKNLRDVAGKPLVAHAVEQVGEASVVDEAVVSTDDPEIRSVARKYGGNVPFERPARLATDTAASVDVVAHALDWFAARDETFDVVAMVQATVPFRTPADVDGAIRALYEADADSVVTVSEFGAPPLWSVAVDDDDLLYPQFQPDVLWADEVPRSQDLPRLLHPNGAVLAVRTAVFAEQRSFYTERTTGYEMPPSRSIDVDNEFDLDLARALAAYRE